MRPTGARHRRLDRVTAHRVEQQRPIRRTSSAAGAHRADWIPRPENERHRRSFSRIALARHATATRRDLRFTMLNGMPDEKADASRSVRNRSRCRHLLTVLPPSSDPAPDAERQTSSHLRGAVPADRPFRCTRSAA